LTVLETVRCDQIQNKTVEPNPTFPETVLENKDESVRQKEKL